MADETPASQAGAAPVSAAPVAPAAPALPQTVTIPLDQLQTFTSIQARLAQVEAEQRSRDDAARAEQVKLLAQKGEIENALRIQREQAEQQLHTERSQRAAIEERAKRYALDGELARALASQPLVQGGAEQLTQLWRNQFMVDAQGDSFAVRTPTFQSVTDFVSSQLAQPQYAHFLRSSNSGGTAGTSGGNLTTPTPPANPGPAAAPRTLGEAVILHMQSMKGNGSADPRLDLSAPMGLRRTS
jgi:hypothetical protein